MADILLLISVAMGFYLVWNIGVNTLGATIGISFGSTKISKTTAAIFASIFAVLGVALLSGRIVDTISRDIVAKLSINGLIAIMIAIVIIATIISYRGIPISTTYAIIGALTGFALTESSGINLKTLEQIIGALFISPFGALLLSFVLFYALKKIALPENAGITKIESLEMKFFLPGFFALLALSFGLGANSVGIVIGLLGGKLAMPPLILLGSAGLVIGVLSWGAKTANKLGVELADLSPSRGFLAMLAAGLIMIGFVYTGIPISTTQTLIGATIGVGLARKNVNVKQALKVAATWLVLLPAALTIISAVFAAIVGFVI